MGNMTPSERPAAPRPAYCSLPAAVKAAILSGNSLSEISVPRWASTYATSEEAVKSAWEAELSRRSQEPNNKYEEMDK
jgi:hypothetical protein